MISVNPAFESRPDVHTASDTGTDETENTSRPPLDECVVSVVLPAFNESAVLETLVKLITRAIKPLGCGYEIIFVNDGSTDGSAALLDRISANNRHVRVVHFSRNFGHQAAVLAGLEHAAGDAIIVMDSDLQDDPASLVDFIDEWLLGFDVVYATRVKRKEAWLKRSLFHAFYRVLNLVSNTPIPNDAGNFGLIDRRVRDSIVSLQDRDRFYPGLRRWVGFRQTGVVVERLARHDDQPRVSMRGLFRLAKSAIFSFSSFPLTMFYGIAGVSALVCGAFIAFALYHKLLTGLAVPGWTSIVITASFFGTLNALGISILGEYVIRIYDQVRSRPPYIVARTNNFQSDRTVRNDSLLDWLGHQWTEDTASAAPAVAAVCGANQPGCGSN